MAAINIPIISEKEYQSFRSIGVKSQFPSDYSAFLEFVKQKNKHLVDSGVITVETQIDFSGFRQWLGAGKYATYNDLLRYAATIIKNK